MDDVSSAIVLDDSGPIPWTTLGDPTVRAIDLSAGAVTGEDAGAQRHVLEAADATNRSIRIVEFLCPSDVIIPSPAFIEALLGPWLTVTRRKNPFVAVFVTTCLHVERQLGLVLATFGEAAYCGAEPSAVHPIGTVPSGTVLDRLESEAEGVTGQQFVEMGLSKSERAAATRLADLTKRGLLIRVPLPGRERDRFVHPMQWLRRVYRPRLQGSAFHLSTRPTPTGEPVLSRSRRPH